MSEFEKLNNSEISKYRYDLSDAEISKLSDELLIEKALDIPDFFRHAIIEVDGKSKYADLGRYIEATVFEKTYGYDIEHMHDDCDLYEDSSRFFISFDRLNGRPVGSLRVIENSKNGLQTINDVQEAPFNININDIVEQH